MLRIINIREIKIYFYRILQKNEVFITRNFAASSFEKHFFLHSNTYLTMQDFSNRPFCPFFRRRPCGA